MFKNPFKKHKKQSIDMNISDCFDDADKASMLSLARQSLECAVTQHEILKVNPNDFDEKLHENRGAFVTLHCDGALRGCIGNIIPNGPLYKTIMGRAYDAALSDNRFYPVTVDELSKIDIEISVLSPPSYLEFGGADDLLAKLRPNVDGVVLFLQNGMSATFLPQVWEQISSPVKFIEELSKKAGGMSDDWRKEGVKVQIYQVEMFKE